MTDDRSLRIKAGQALARMVATAAGRAALREAGHRDGHPIFVSLASDTLGDIMNRVMVDDPPALVAVYDNTQLRFVLFSRGAGGDIGDGHEVHADSTIAMVLDYMATSQRQTLEFALTNWTGGQLKTIEPPVFA